MFSIHPFSFLSQSHEIQFDEVWVCALWDVTNRDIVGIVFLGDNVDVDDHSKTWIRNDNDSNKIVFVHEFVTVSFVFIRCCCVVKL
jgi:hypothetical protein